MKQNRNMFALCQLWRLTRVLLKSAHTVMMPMEIRILIFLFCSCSRLLRYKLLSVGLSHKPLLHDRKKLSNLLQDIVNFTGVIISPTKRLSQTFRETPMKWLGIILEHGRNFPTLLQLDPLCINPLKRHVALNVAWIRNKEFFFWRGGGESWASVSPS